MREQYRYEGEPEPGFNIRLKQAVARYFAFNEDRNALRFDILRLYADHPDLKTGSTFTAKIMAESGHLYNFLEYNRHKPKPEFIIIGRTNSRSILNN